MTANFIPLAEDFLVSPQIGPQDVAAAKDLGVALVINNRPDGEEPGQPSGAAIEAAARAAGIDYVAIPISGLSINPGHLDAFDRAVAGARGRILAYCRSGTRSTALRAFARARAGADVDAVIGEAANAGYNIAGQRRTLEALARSER
ncbi:MAG: TIGR01244 family phosphatase [Parvularculaceae bacterium]|nr:TIGR01244 family phosphatase [Parvularculaceae bacterium]